MKRINKLALLILGFAAGALSGAFIRLGFEMLGGRPSSVGGEALIIPLIVVLIIFGFSLGKQVRVQGRYYEAFRCGYRRGYDQGQRHLMEEIEISLQQPGRIEADQHSVGL